MCDRVGVMYAGKFVEQAPVQPLFDNPAHPYTEALMRSVPDLEVDVDHLPSIDGQPPSPDDLPPGCAFAPRCEYAFDKCEVYPDVFKIGENHTAACWRHSGEYASNN
jgi:oligopeptide/dipeptide ABC transporter ATP-binding protein